MANAAPQSTGELRKAKTRSALLGIIYMIVIDALLPYLIYTVLTDHTHIPEIVALVASGVPPLIDAIVSVVRKGHFDIIAGLVLLSIAVGVVLVFMGRSPRVYLIRESFFTAAIGLAYLVSLFFPKPLGFYFARTFVTGNVPEKVTWFNSLWQYPHFRHSMTVSTVVWGVGFLLEAVVRTILVLVLTIPQFLLISPFVLYGFIGGIILWTFWYSRQGRKRAAELERQAGENSAVPATATSAANGN